MFDYYIYEVVAFVFGIRPNHILENQYKSKVVVEVRVMGFI
jgi:hypothetical protein